VEALQELHGVGPKVADCIALFSLDKLEAVPCDTHVWQIAQRYLPALRSKNPAPALHPLVREFFLKQFGDKCGWAHTVLFAAELREFQAVLEGSPTAVVAGKVKKEAKATLDMRVEQAQAAATEAVLSVEVKKELPDEGAAPTKRKRARRT